jgi:hypothetical protein
MVQSVMNWLRDLAASLPRVLPRRRRSAAPEPVPPGQLTTVAAVVDRLRAIDQALPADDGVAAFNRMYLQVTELVGARITDGLFDNNEFITRLDVVFAGLYLEAVDSPPATASPCWRPLLQRRGRRLLPIQFAMAGMNAHINHDLPAAVERTCRQLGLTPASPGLFEDYQRVTGVLASVHEQVRQSFLDPLLLPIDREVSPLVTLLGSWSVGRARDAAWVNTEVLWQLRDQEVLQAEFARTLSHTVGMASRQLLLPLSTPRGGMTARS